MPVLELVTNIAKTKCSLQEVSLYYLIDLNFRNYKYIILYLGRSGKKILKQALKLWQFDYEEKKSLTNDESIIVKIYNLKKK